MKSYEEWLAEAYQEALNSPDPSTQNGAIVLDSDYNELGRGCNTFTPGVDITPDKLERPLKYSYIEHAERNAVFACLRTITTQPNGEWKAKARPAVMICPWAACTECARAIIQSGIKTLVRHQDASDRSPDRWIESIEFSDDLLYAAGVDIIRVKGSLKEYGAPEILHCEEVWQP